MFVSDTMDTGNSKCKLFRRILTTHVFDRFESGVLDTPTAFNPGSMTNAKKKHKVKESSDDNDNRFKDPVVRKRFKKSGEPALSYRY